MRRNATNVSALNRRVHAGGCVMEPAWWVTFLLPRGLELSPRSNAYGGASNGWLTLGQRFRTTPIWNGADNAPRSPDKMRPIAGFRVGMVLEFPDSRVARCSNLGAGMCATSNR